MLQIKAGVVFKYLIPEILGALSLLNEIFRKRGKDCVVTSAHDGDHQPKSGRPSLHYQDRALDLRSHHLDPKTQQSVLEEIRERLGKDWDVLLEYPNTPNEHYHIEYDPK